MSILEQLGNVISTDVLVVGGGISGIVAALKAREVGVEVTVVDKASVGFGGMSARAGNGLLVLKKDQDIDEYVRYHVENIGRYINDQDMLRRFAEINYKCSRALSDWGVQLTTDKNGDIGYYPLPGAPWFGTGVELNMVPPLKKHAKNSGVKIINNVKISTLFKDGNRVIGAAGFSVINGEYYIFRAKSVVIATAGCGFRVIRMFNGRGEGIKLAWEAGAQMRSAEFGNFFEAVTKETGEQFHGTMPFMYNQKGENIYDKYNTWDAPDITPEMIVGMTKETLEGNGPIYVDMDKKDADMEWKGIGGSGAELNGMTRFFPDKLAWVKRTSERNQEFFNLGRKPEMLVGLHANLGPIRVNIDMQTTVDGLFAVGLDVWIGSAMAGCVPPPGMQRGNSLMHGVTSGFLGGTAAAEYAKKTNEGKVDVSAAENHKNDLIKNMMREEGLDTEELILRMHQVVAKTKYNLYRSEERLKEAISKIDALTEDASNYSAGDPHMLNKGLELQSMLLSAKIAFCSALERRESRGFHFREDYPETDNVNWLKWVLADNVNGELRISTEDIPIDQYKFKPENFRGN